MYDNAIRVIVVMIQILMSILLHIEPGEQIKSIGHAVDTDESSS